MLRKPRGERCTGPHRPSGPYYREPAAAAEARTHPPLMPQNDSISRAGRWRRGRAACSRSGSPVRARKPYAREQAAHPVSRECTLHRRRSFTTPANRTLRSRHGDALCANPPHEGVQVPPRTRAVTTRGEIVASTARACGSYFNWSCRLSYSLPRLSGWPSANAAPTSPSESIMA